MICDYCDGENQREGVEVYEVEDPWGGHHGYICEVCNDDAAERQATGGF